MKTIKFLFLALLFFSLGSCEILEEAYKVVENMDAPLTEQEVIEGLKEALTIGSENAVDIVSVKDGFFKDQLIKITFPEEASFIIENKDNPLLQAVGISQKIDDVILSMNRAAENAAKEAAPIFAGVVKKMTVRDGFEILNGADNAATQYLKDRSYQQLKSAFKPKVKKSLDKPLVGNISTNQAWETLKDAYNGVAQFAPGLQSVNTSLDDHVTDKALEGLFAKLALEEKKIRKDPAARVTDLLKRVFGQ